VRVVPVSRARNGSGRRLACRNFELIGRRKTVRKPAYAGRLRLGGALGPPHSSEDIACHPA